MNSRLTFLTFLQLIFFIYFSLFSFPQHQLLLLKTIKALNGLLCADVPLSNYALSFFEFLITSQELLTLITTVEADDNTDGMRFLPDVLIMSCFLIILYLFFPAWLYTDSWHVYWWSTEAVVIYAEKRKCYSQRGISGLLETAYCVQLFCL